MNRRVNGNATMNDGDGVTRLPAPLSAPVGTGGTA